MNSMDTPSSLFQLTLKFIGHHLSLLDSLVGFPESIGQEIFQCASKLEQFSSLKNDSESRRNLKLFFEAYSTNGILDSLSLDGNYLFFNDVIDECMWLFDGLVQLDLSFCSLGDNHDALPLLVNKPRLQTLALCNNSLTDEGIRKLTIPIRMFKKSSSLTCLDISDNKDLSDRCVHHLNCLQNLQVINIYNTGITLKAKQGSWSVLDTRQPCSCVQSKFSCITSGWACDVINRWKSMYKVKENKNKDTAKLNLSTSASFNFYSRKKNPVTIPATSFWSSPDDRKFQVLFRSAFTCPHRKTRLDSKPSETATNNLDIHGGAEPGVSKAACDQEDLSLLQQYTHSPPKKKQEHHPLLQQYSHPPPKKKQRQNFSLKLLDLYNS